MALLRAGNESVLRPVRHRPHQSRCRQMRRDDRSDRDKIARCSSRFPEGYYDEDGYTNARLVAQLHGKQEIAGEDFDITEYIQGLRPHLNLYVSARVSTDSQRPHLPSQLDVVKDEATLQGVTIAGCSEGFVCHGWDMDGINAEVDKAIANEADGLLLADRTRVAHSEDYHPKTNRNAPLTRYDCEKLRKATKGFPIFTAMNPNASLKEICDRQSNNWNPNKTKGGRPRKKKRGDRAKRFEEKLPDVLDFHDGGNSPKQIASRTGMPCSTIYKWLKRFRPGWSSRKRRQKRPILARLF